MCPWRNWIAHLIPNQKVVGSIPIGHTIETKDLYKRPPEQRKRSGISLEIRTSQEVLFLLSLEFCLFSPDYRRQTIPAVFRGKDEFSRFQFKLSCLGSSGAAAVRTHSLKYLTASGAAMDIFCAHFHACSSNSISGTHLDAIPSSYAYRPVKSSFRNI